MAEHPPVPIRQMVAMLNFDMVGRLRDDRVIVYGMATATGMRAIIDSANVGVGLTLWHLERHARLAAAFYIVLGWVGLLALPQLVGSLSIVQIALLAGGVMTRSIHEILDEESHLVALSVGAGLEAALLLGVT